MNGLSDSHGSTNNLEPNVHLFQRLDTDWNQLVAGYDGRSACLRWNRTDLVLTHVRCPGQLVREIRTAADPARSDELLSAVVALAPTDQMAARVVLQALVPGLLSLVHKLRTLADPEDVEAAVVAAAWTRIRTYPRDRRPRYVATNILLDTRKDTLRQLRRDDIPSVDENCPIAADSQDDLHAVLREAERRGLISADEAELIGATRVSGQTLATAAEQYGVSSEALRKRRARAEARLRLVAGAC